MESHLRTVVKTISWRLVATLITFSVAWVATGTLKLAAEIGIADTLIKLCVYYWHERGWIRVKFGKAKRPDYEI